MKMNFTFCRNIRIAVDAARILSQSTKINYAKKARGQREHESRDNRTRIPPGLSGICLQGDR
ncbi:hypothetical protein GHJ82_09840 [Sinorhizobium saheli]|nr:hypothetical protein [Sinorhizobium saheli]